MIFLFVFIAIISFVTCQIMFDLLIRHQYRRHRSHWEMDGRPIGMFRVPPGASRWRGGVARNRCFKRWAFFTPAWVSNDREALTLLLWVRVAFAVLMSVSVGPLVIVFVEDVFR
jgi:hypothetical protein